MFHVLGGDDKEYGPVSTDQVRQWITQRRLSAHSLARRDDEGMRAAGQRSQEEAGWKPLSLFPEFASALAAPTFVPRVVPEAEGSGKTLGIIGFISSLLSIV